MFVIYLVVFTVAVENMWLVRSVRTS